MKRPAGIVVAGHLCLDLIPSLPEHVDFTPNTLTRIGGAVVAPGGCVCNVGLALHRLGMPVRMLGRIGDDALGRLLREEIDRVDPGLSESLLVASGESTSYSLVIAPGSSDRLFWHCTGTNDTFAADDIPSDAFARSQWLHFGYPPAMRGIMLDGGAGLAGLFERARTDHLRTSLDFCSIDPQSDAGRVDWRGWLARVLPQTDLAAPSFDEMAGIFGFPTDRATESNVRAVAGELLSLGAGAVALKLGDRGLYFRDATVEHHVPCFQVNVAGTTGAGDCTIAGLIASLTSGEPLQTALTIAAAVGACCCERADATSGVIPLDKVKARLAAGWARRPTTLFGEST